MQARVQLAALDHNHNVDRDLAMDKDNNPIVRQVFSKAQKDWILRQVYDKKQYRRTADKNHCQTTWHDYPYGQINRN